MYFLPGISDHTISLSLLKLSFPELLARSQARTKDHGPGKDAANAIRKNKDIVGLAANNIQIKFSQHVGDTTLVLDGSEKSLIAFLL